MSASDERARVEYLLRLGDSDLILGQRLIAWIGHAPVLEEELALGNVALDLIGQARLWLSYAAEREGAGRDEDALAYFRQAHEFRNVLLVERPNDDFAVTMARQFFYDVWHLELLRALAGSNDERIAAIAAKGAREVEYHAERSRDWVVRLGDGTAESRARMQRAVDALWPYTGELFAPDAVDAEAARARLGHRPRGAARALARRGGRRADRGDADRAARRRLDAVRRQDRPPQRGPRLSPGRDAVGAPLRPGSDVVNAAYDPAASAHDDVAAVWQWLADVPDPEIPVLSVVDLGIVREVALARLGRRAGAARRDLADLLRLPGDRGDPARHRARRCARTGSRTCGSRCSSRRPGRRTGSPPPARRSCARTASRRPRRPSAIACPRCAAGDVQLVSRFGSTPCKALYRCNACREPFDHFKCH